MSVGIIFLFCFILFFPHINPGSIWSMSFLDKSARFLFSVEFLFFFLQDKQNFVTKWKYVLLQTLNPILGMISNKLIWLKAGCDILAAVMRK